MKENKNMGKYQKHKVFKFDERTWPQKELDKAPLFCSVDLRDGNQSLVNPMDIESKIEFFELLADMGFKEIEIGFPSASDTEFNFLRKLITENRIPKDVRVQVLVQAREHLIKRTYEALDGIHSAIVHVYNSTSTAQREMVFKKSTDEIKEIAIEGAVLVKKYAELYPDTKFTFEYSPESFTGTEMEYALEVCEAVLEVWKPAANNKAIINLPATVEMTSPNVYADQIEWFCKNLSKREAVLISLHTHNDRGTGVAATELAILAGADRVEGTLFGNGERTGNLDILTLAMNYYSQGIEPNIYVEDMKRVIDVYEKCTGMNVHERHPYAGSLVYTAFSGSHQDAIKKALEYYEENDLKVWNIPYLPIDPDDVGRAYEPIIRINSQSGKGGIAYILESEYGYKCPKAMQPVIGNYIQKEADKSNKEITSKEIFEIFEKQFINVSTPNKVQDISYSYNEKEKDSMIVSANVFVNGKHASISGIGNGPISAFFNGIEDLLENSYQFVDYEEHSLSNGQNAEAAAYVQLKNQHGISNFGIGRDTNINNASIKAIMSALNKF